MRFSTLQKFLFLIILLSFAPIVSAQKAIYKTADDKSEIVITPLIDRQALIEEDEKNEESGGPTRAALLYPLDINSDNAGVWEDLSGGLKTWMLTIKIPESYGLIVRYSDFYIPQGGKVYVYSKDYPDRTAIYTSSNNIGGGPYSTEVSAGSQITIEYVGSAKWESPRLQISEIGYKYRQMGDAYEEVDNKLKGFNDDDNECMININCPEGNDWQNQQKGVVRITVKIGGSLYYCSGSLVNNTNYDRTPYILSACHCYEIKDKLADFDTAEYSFNYEFPTCENQSTPPGRNRIIGATPLVLSSLDGGSDGALLKLSKDIDPDWDVYYNGWNVESRNNIITKGAVIHHPQGDVKKITLYDSPLTTVTWTTDEGKAIPNAHWVATYSKGVTQGGSSGAPIFDQNGLIVGTLTGGSSTCTHPTYPDYYAKFAYNWNKNEDTNLWMQKYLDPQNKNATQLAGWNGAASQIVLEKQSVNLNIAEIATVKILEGSGGYTVTSSDSTMVSAKIENSNEINIIGYSGGNAMLTIKDKSGNSILLPVTISNTINDDSTPSIFAWWSNAQGSENKNILTVRAKDETNSLKNIKIFNIYGNVYKKDNLDNLNSYTYDIDTSLWPNGVYILVVDGTKESRQFKIVK